MTEPAVASSDARNIQTTIAARRRRLRHQRPQVVDLGCQRPALQDPDRDGPHQPRRGEPSAAVDDPGADRTPRASPSCARLPVFGWQDQHGHAEIVFDNVRVPASQPARRGGWRVRDRPGPAGPRPDPSLHARHRGGRAGAGPDGRPGEQADRVRQAARRAGRGAAAGCLVPQRDRPGQAAVREGGVDHRPARQQGGRATRSR